MFIKSVVFNDNSLEIPLYTHSLSVFRDERYVFDDFMNA